VAFTMAKPGRKSRAELETLPLIRAETERLSPPASLSPSARAIFLDLVTTTKASHFEPSDLPLLCRFCEATALAQQAEGALASGGAVIDGAVSPWVAILGQQTKVLQGLSMRLRLSPQARQPNNPTRPQTQTLSYYERARLDRGDTPLPARSGWPGWSDK
jgi:phage terminase small subunit